MRPLLTLGQFLFVCFAALAVLLVVLLSIFYEGSRRTVLLASEELMRQAGRRVTERIDGYLGEAERVVASLEAQAALGLVDPAEPGAIERALVSALTEHPRITEVAFTHGQAIGFYAEDEGPHDAGDVKLAPGSGGQVSLTRAANGDVVARHAWETEGGWVAEERRLPGDAAPHPVAMPATPPTLHATFTVPSREEHKRHALWSDLAYAEADAALPEPSRRRVVSVQEALFASDASLLGVLRVALDSDSVDELTDVRIDERTPTDTDHRIFLCDRFGRLISRLGAADRFALLDVAGNLDPDGGDVRIVPAAPPAEVVAALEAPMLRDVAAGGFAVTRLDVGGTPYLASVAALLGERSRGWLVGIVVPEAHYLRELEASRLRVLGYAALLMIGSAGVGALMLRSVRRDLGRLIGETTRLRTFDFAPTKSRRGAFRDVAAASQSLEQAKTALRALGKYVPLALVRQLYEARTEPRLGAKLENVTLLFSDIEGFTSVSEQLSPDALAVALGAYLEAMTGAIHASGGIIDKYTGDGVMALWNTPQPIDHPAARACAAALASRTAMRALFASTAWKGLAPWVTRFGIHCAEVNVGHFGAPDRMSFTAMGDGVNLASRLESLNKQYGTHILVSAAVEEEARRHFCFRRIDRVAVKGKQEGVEIFELVGRKSPLHYDRVPIERYERALDAYHARLFEEALALLEGCGADGPSRVLAERCRRFLAEPPPSDWNGVYVAREK